MMDLIAPQFDRVQVCPLQIIPPITQPLSSAELAPVMVNEPEYVLPSSAL
jgi:hypothetical protein